MRIRSLVWGLCLGLVLTAGCAAPDTKRLQTEALSDLAGWRGAAPKSANDFSFVIMSDRTGGHVPGEWSKAVARINLLNPDFVVCVGDLIEGYEQDAGKLKAQWDEFEELTRKLRAPFFYCPGNHDVQRQGETDLMLDTYVRRHGVGGRSYYSFNYRGCHFIVLDSVTATARPDFAQEMLDWLGRDLAAAAAARQVFVFYHYPLWDDQKVWPRLKTMLPQGKTTVFNGHWHRSEYRVADGIPTYVLVATGAGVGEEEPRAFVHVSVSDDAPRLALLPTEAIRSAGSFEDLGHLRLVRQRAWLGSLYRTGQPVTFRQANPLDVPVAVSLEWNAPGWTPASAQAALTVPPGKEEAALFTFVPTPQAQSVSLKTTTEFPGTDKQPFRHVTTWEVPVCETTEVPRTGALADLDSVRDALQDQLPRIVRAGETKVGELRVAVAGESLAVSARVFDPRCTAESPEWPGCNVDVYVARPGEPTVRQFVFFARSPEGRKELGAYENGQKREGVTCNWRIVPMKPFGYEVHALVPLSQLLLKPDVRRFLLDCAVAAPLERGGKPQFTLLYTGDPNRCAFRNNRFYALAEVK